MGGFVGGFVGNFVGNIAGNFDGHVHLMFIFDAQSLLAMA